MGSTLGRWGKKHEGAEKPNRFKGVLVPQRRELFPNVPRATLGPNHAQNQRRIRIFPNVPTLMRDSTPTVARDCYQLSLPRLGPEVGDGFRFTWWNTREGAAVWIEHQGRWHTGVVVGLGRKRAAVAIEAMRFKRLLVVIPYSQLRRRTGDAR
jgi:hypothetical protein